MPIELTDIPATLYCTASQVGSGLGITLGGDSGEPDTATVDAWIERASRRLDKENADIPFNTQSATEYHHMTENIYYLVTKKRPIVSITSIHQWDGTVWREYTEDTDLTHLNSIRYFYCTDKTNGIVKFTSKESVGEDRLRIIYSYGYASVPKWIEDMCVKMVSIAVIDHMITTTSIGAELTQSEEVLNAWHRTKRLLIDEINDMTKKHLRNSRISVGVL